MTNKSAQAGIIAPLILIIVVLAVVVGGYFYLNKGGTGLPSVVPSPDVTSSDGQVELKSEYKNPFEQDSQYVNPFSEYKNPLDSLK